MSTFKYKARNMAGEIREGVVEAASMETAIDVLQRNNLILINITPSQTAGFFNKSFNIFAPVKTSDLVIFTRQLSTLFSAKVPVIQSLRTLAEEAPNKAFREIVLDLVDRIAGGSSLSQALAEHPDAFSSFYVNLVKSGEESGKLENTFEFLAGYLERSEYLASKARNALIYPAFILSVFVIVAAVLFSYVIPKLVTILEETGQDLPWYTQLVIFVSHFLVSYGVFILILLLIGAIVLWRFLKTELGKQLFDRVLIQIPIIGQLYRKIFLSRIADNLSTLFSGGISILDALKITSDVVDNRVYQKILLDAADSVRAGSTISAAFSKYNDVPPLVTQMIKIGEETGQLDFILNKVSGFYRQEVDNILSNLVSLIEPILIVSLGGGVALIVAAIFVPLYGVTNAIN